MCLLERQARFRVGLRWGVAEASTYLCRITVLLLARVPMGGASRGKARGWRRWPVGRWISMRMRMRHQRPVMIDLIDWLIEYFELNTTRSID